jgi:PEGA domain
VLVAVLVSSRHSAASASPPAVSRPIVVPPAAMAPVVRPDSVRVHAESAKAPSVKPKAPPAPRVVAAAPSSTAVAPAAPPASGKLRVRVLPGDASIYVDGRLLGNGAVIDSALPVGTRQLHVVAEGYRSYDTLVTVAPDSTTVLGTLTLKPAP